jgi:hypothetical protein
MSSLGTREQPHNQGKMFVKQTIKRIGQSVKAGYLKMRMKADDSDAVCMSDKTLGKGISSE